MSALSHCFRLPVAACLVLVAAQAGATPAAASAPLSGAGTRTVVYRGYALDVPLAWPVIDLTGSPSRCVTFNQHAVYLGRPGVSEACPTHEVGRTEVVMVQPLTTATTTQMAHASVVAAGRLAPIGLGAAAQEVSFAVPSAGVFVTATWHFDPALVQRVLASARLTGAAHAATWSAPAVAALRAAPVAGMVSGTAPRPASVPASVSVSLNGLGFDACTAPSSSDMSAWRSASPYASVGIYIGGENRGCAQPNLTSAWVGAEQSAGWHFIPTYVGLQAPGNGCGCSSISPVDAAGQGVLAADDAAARAGALGLRTGDPIYFDMESYPRGPGNTPVVLSFLASWTSRLHADGYLSGVYSSSSTGISDLVSQYGSGYIEPDDLWIANWNSQQGTSDPWVPSGEWSNHQRLHQYAGGHPESWGGVAINIDSDYLDGAAAPAGIAAAVLSRLPTPEPVTAFTVSWSMPAGAPAVTSFSLFVRDGSGPWQVWSHGAANQVSFFGFASHQYGFYAEAFTADGRSSGGPLPADVTSTTVAAGAPSTTPFTSMYAVDGYGVLHPASSPPLATTATWQGWNIARGLALNGSGHGGVVADGWGGLHPFGDVSSSRGGSYWPGWDIVRGVAVVPGGTAGWQLDGWGGLHPFALGSANPSPAASGAAYWAGWDIARGLAAFSDGSGGVELDGFGGVHPFTTGSAVASGPVVTGYWSGWDIARAVTLVPGSTAARYSGYVLDGWGGIHPFASSNTALPQAVANATYWRGADVARSLVLVPQHPAQGYTVDLLGGFSPFGGAPAVVTPNYGAGGTTVRAGAAS